MKLVREEESYFYISSFIIFLAGLENLHYICFQEANHSVLLFPLYIEPNLDELDQMFAASTWRKMILN